MTGLIRVLSQNKLSEYPKSDGVFWLKDFGEGKVVLDGLVPPKPLTEFWEHSQKGENDWKVYKSVYEDLLQSTKAKKDLMYLCTLAKRGKTCNVVCDCWDGKKCIRTLVFNALVEMSASAFLD